MGDSYDPVSASITQLHHAIIFASAILSPSRIVSCPSRQGRKQMARATGGTGTEQVAHVVVHYIMNISAVSYMRLHWAGLIGCLAVVLVAWGGPAGRASAQFDTDIEYGVGDGSRHLDAYLPREPTPHPAAVCIHGGGWRGEDKGGYRRTAMWYATHGVAAFAINYRLSGVAPYPAAVDDCLAAIRFLRGHADEYNIDIDRMGVEGGSAGGHLVLMMALMESGSDELDSAAQWPTSALSLLPAHRPPLRYF